MRILPLTFFCLLQLIKAAQAPEMFQFRVMRERLLRDEPGELTINEGGVSYRSDNGKSRIELPFADIREADVANPKKIVFQTYDLLKLKPGQRHTYVFKLKQDPKPGQELARFLAQKVAHPVIGEYSMGEDSLFRIAAYHRHVLGGTHGTIEIGREAIRYVTGKKGDARTWPYKDIESIGSSGPFSFRVTTYAETYTFDLKETLPQDAYDFAWQQLYRPNGKEHTPALIPSSDSFALGSERKTPVKGVIAERRKLGGYMIKLARYSKLLPVAWLFASTAFSAQQQSENLETKSSPGRAQSVQKAPEKGREGHSKNPEKKSNEGMTPRAPESGASPPQQGREGHSKNPEKKRRKQAAPRRTKPPDEMQEQREGHSKNPEKKP